MAWKSIRSGVSMLLISLLWACRAEPARGPAYPLLSLEEAGAPLAGDRSFAAWRPPRQMAAFVHPHEDPAQGLMIAGHWILLLLGEGRWYFQEEVDREPLPDAEATPEDRRRALGAIQVPPDAVVPFRSREGAKP